jgi:hypothetical protein
MNKNIAAAGTKAQNPAQAGYLCLLCPRLDRFAYRSSARSSSSLSVLFLVTDTFPDGKVPRPRLAVFAFRFAQTKTSLRPTHAFIKQNVLLK